MRRTAGCLVVECGPLRPKRRRPSKLILASITHTFVIDDGVVITTLGYGMKSDRIVTARRRIRRALAAKGRAA